MFKQCIYQEVVPMSEAGLKKKMREKRGTILDFFTHPSTKKSWAIIQQEDGFLTEAPITDIEVVR